MTHYAYEHLSRIRVDELRREADQERLVLAARQERRAGRRRLKRLNWLAWRARWRAREAIL